MHTSISVLAYGPDAPLALAEQEKQIDLDFVDEAVTERLHGLKSFHVKNVA